MNRIFCRKYEIAYQKKVLEKYAVELGKDKVITKSYLYLVHAAATIEWSMKFNEQPPIHLQTLLFGLNRHNVWDAVKEILDYARRIARDIYVRNGAKPHESHYGIKAAYNEVIERYVNGIASDSDVPSLDHIVEMEGNQVVSDMHKIIYESVFCNEEVVSDCVWGGAKRIGRIVFIKRGGYCCA